MSQNTQSIIKTTVLALINLAVAYGVIAQDKSSAIGAALVGVVTVVAGLAVHKFQKK
jgi:hypothetical protein